MYVTSALNGSNTHVLVSIVFTNKEYKGSTLELQGRSAQFDEVREVAVVGGTGKFRLARGYVTFETIYYDPTISYAVIQCNVTARATILELTLGQIWEKGRNGEYRDMDAGKCKDEEVEGQGQWLLDGKNSVGDHYMKSCCVI
ncbi:unnamed protein product [Fraxinus pennsylvanica]|uniref:Dirigent protein n=1 Tax=Fraxinus pennsylvanica TaxID=56036 RepID=A0AAD2AAZ9_9LAMI|nr:unnamed protein product [Fraxinus pennsylvanica]